jgi:primosomal protein N' (replication factor Y)
LKHKDYEKVKESAQWLYQVLQQNLNMSILGPEEPAISKIRNEYIRTIMIKIPEKVSQQGTKKTIQKILNSFEAIAQYRAVKLIINIDPL